MKVVESSPHASHLIESLRDFGYSLESALADIIDNSISAEAKHIDVFAEFLPDDQYIAVLDNGTGMSFEELVSAMRLGSQNPLDNRSNDDLGRFGLGLKTASFSQCRKLTVVSRQNERLVAAQWDLDHVAETNSWQLIIPDSLQDIPHVNELTKRGTLILWQNLDRLTEKASFLANQHYFTSQIAKAADHLALVFHRYLVSEPGHHKLAIRINGNPVKPIDPFLIIHPRTQKTPEEVFRVNDHQIKIQGYTLPPAHTISREDFDKIAGSEGLVKNQGFYVYRERRLIIWGTWFGLARKSEVSKLTRVRIDIGNDTDADWKIDVRKSSAQPPLPVRERLRELMERLQVESRQAHGKSRRRSRAEQLAVSWISGRKDGVDHYSPNMEHPVIRKHLESLTPEQTESFLLVLNNLASSLPLDQIHNRLSTDPKSLEPAEIDRDSLRDTVLLTWQFLVDQGTQPEVIRKFFRLENQFKAHRDFVNSILATLEEGKL